MSQGPAGFHSLPPELVDNIIWRLGFTDLFNASRCIPAVEDVWFTYTLSERYKRLESAREIEDQVFFDALSDTEKKLAIAIAVEITNSARVFYKAYMDPSNPKHVAERIEEENIDDVCKRLTLTALKPIFLSTAIHLVCLANAALEPRIIPEVEEKENLTWHNKFLLKHANKLSTVRLFDLANKMEMVDVYLRTRHNQVDCVNGKTCGGLWECSRMKKSTLKVYKGVLSNLQLWFEHVMMSVLTTPQVPFGRDISTTLRNCLKEKVAIKQSNPDRTDSYSALVYDFVINRLAYPYRFDNEWPGTEDAIYYDPLHADFHAFDEWYLDFIEGGDWDWLHELPQLTREILLP
ncbi:hypothetical protein ABW19_dt0201345 [Dactylella cylindrospora]|nr:hypothetical protein ABW19_dt0201345 [Dactylella cylindrospora]